MFGILLKSKKEPEWKEGLKHKKVELDVSPSTTEALMPLLQDLKELSSMGASRDILVAPGDKELESKHFIDGDGPHMIFEMRVDGEVYKKPKDKAKKGLPSKPMRVIKKGVLSPGMKMQRPGEDLEKEMMQAPGSNADKKSVNNMLDSDLMSPPPKQEPKGNPSTTDVSTKTESVPVFKGSPMSKVQTMPPGGGTTPASTAPKKPIITTQASGKPSKIAAGIMTPGEGTKIGEMQDKGQNDDSRILISGG